MIPELWLHPPIYISATIQDLEITAYSYVSAIDELLRPVLNDPQLPRWLSNQIHEKVSIPVTPGYDDFNRPDRDLIYYRYCLTFAALIGRAYTLLRPADVEGSDTVLSKFAALPAELRFGIYEHYLQDRQLWLDQRKRLWQVMSGIFIKALFSGSHPEDGARFATAIIFLTCGQSLAETPELLGWGKRWVWYSDVLAEPHEVWNLYDVQDAVLATEQLPTENWDYEVVKQRNASSALPEFVSRETLWVLNRARRDLIGNNPDLTSEEVAEWCIPRLEAFAREVEVRERTIKEKNLGAQQDYFPLAECSAFFDS